MYQYLAAVGTNGGTSPTGLLQSGNVWGVAGGARLEWGPLRLGVSAFHGAGLGVYVALQNSSTSFNTTTRELRTFTGLYGQMALVFGRSQVSAGLGQVTDDQLASDKQDASTSGLKSQAGISAGYYFSVTEHLVVGFDYFRFQADWWGAPNSTFDANGNTVILSGSLPAERQVINFFNVGVTFHW
jgi:hypothetical protein